MADDQDLVSEVRIEGIGESTAELKKYGDDGAAAFDKVGEAAKKSGDAVADSTNKMGKAADDAGKKVDQLPTKLNAIANAAGNLVGAARSGAQGLASFGAAITGVVAAGVAGVAGIAKFASAVTSAVREVDRAADAAKESANQQKKNNEQWVQSVTTAAQYQSQLNQLNRQVALGRVSYEDYNSQLVELNATYQEQVRVQAQVQAAQDEALRQNQQLERQARQRADLEALNKTYGVTLTQSLIQLGAAYDRVAFQARDAFGPVLASLADRITATIDRNSGQITKFIDNAAKSMDDFFKQNGPAIDKMIAQIVELGAAFVKVVTSVIVPAVGAVMGALNTIADLINKVFGTNINGAFLAVILLIGTLSGAFSALATVIGLVTTAVGFLATAFSPLVVVIGLLIAAFVALAVSIDWTAFAQRAVAAGQAILNFFTQLPANIGKVFADFFQFVTDGFNALVQGIFTIWQTVVDYFNGFVQVITDIFNSIGQSIQNAFNTALQFVIGLFTTWSTAVMRYIQPIIDALNKVKQLISQTSGGGGASGAVAAAGGGHIRGPGTSTSDSIPAWLSDGEFVVRAKSVAKYGLGLLRAINSGKLDLGGAIQRFATGGLVSAFSGGVQRFATGGLASSNGPAGKVFDLHIGNDVFRGLIAPDDVADKMVQFSVASNTRKAGRRPGWYGGKR